jgi:hypothetical protein
MTATAKMSVDGFRDSQHGLSQPKMVSATPEISSDRNRRAMCVISFESATAMEILNRSFVDPDSLEKRFAEDHFADQRFQPVAVRLRIGDDPVNDQ